MKNIFSIIFLFLFSFSGFSQAVDSVMTDVNAEIVTNKVISTTGLKAIFRKLNNRTKAVETNAAAQTALKADQSSLNTETINRVNADNANGAAIAAKANTSDVASTYETKANAVDKFNYVKHISDIRADSLRFAMKYIDDYTLVQLGNIYNNISNTSSGIVSTSRIGVKTTTPYTTLDVRGGTLGVTTSDFLQGSVGSVGFIGMGNTSGNTYVKFNTGTAGDNLLGHLALQDYAGSVGINGRKAKLSGSALEVNEGIVSNLLEHPPVLGVNRDFTVYHIGNSTLGFTYRGQDGVTRTSEYPLLGKILTSASAIPQGLLTVTTTSATQVVTLSVAPDTSTDISRFDVFLQNGSNRQLQLPISLDAENGYQLVFSGSAVTIVFPSPVLAGEKIIVKSR